MKDPKLIITPKTKVGELLDRFPELEKVLMEMSPAFESFKNPVLRRTVAKVATLQQIAVVGGLKVDQIVNSLRQAAGQQGYSKANQLEDDGIFELTSPFIPAPVVEMLMKRAIGSIL